MTIHDYIGLYRTIWDYADLYRTIQDYIEGYRGLNGLLDGLIKTGDRQTDRHTDRQNLWNLEGLTHLKIVYVSPCKEVIYYAGNSLSIFHGKKQLMCYKPSCASPILS